MLKGKIALVTGGSRGIGRAVAVRLAKGGAFTYVNYVRNETAAEETLSLIRSGNGEGALCPFDIEDADAVRAAVGRIDILVNILGLTKSLARELAARNICVNAVSPGFIETDMTTSIPEDMKAEMHRMIPLERLGRPEDVAGVVAFLASDEADYVTGQVLHVNGGLYM